jgi:malonyl-CoA/methylmalonyl-CoA synthetase
LDDVAKFRDELSSFVGTQDLQGGRVAFLVESGYNYVVTLFTIWALGGFAVPLCTTHPIHEMLYTVTDSNASLLLASKHFEPRISELAGVIAKEFGEKQAFYIVPHHPPRTVNGIPSLINSPIADPMRHALMIYTSGTTGKPKVILRLHLSDKKGVVSAHRTVQAQIDSLVQYWRITQDDRIVHVLPLHHIHGIVNALLVLLWVSISSTSC